MDKIPTTIITGFLGSGKTTIIKNAVESIWDNEKVAIIKNEISDVGVDALELSSPKLNVTELPNGCICCTLVGALNDSVNEIIEKYEPDRLIIEASGFAKPGQIVIGLDLVEKIKIDGVIVVIDCLNYKKLREIDKAWSAQIQTEFIDLYILNKVNQVTEAEIDIIKDDILGLNPSARIIETNDAILPTDIIWGLNENFLNFEIEKSENHDHNFEDWESFVIENFKFDNINNFKIILENLPKLIYRAKGYFKSKETKSYIINVVFGKVNIDLTEKILPENNKLVFIGRNISKYKEMIKSKLI